MKKAKRKIFFSLVLTCILCAITACGKSVKEENEESVSSNTVVSTEAEQKTEESADSETETVDIEADDTSEDSAIPCPSVNGALHVSGTELLDEKNQVVQLKGVSTHGLAWFPEYVNEDAFSTLHNEWNVSVIRLAMYTADSGGYCTDSDQENLKNLIDDGVAYATNQDMYVIIDWHILSDGNPNQYKEQAKVFFDEMSKKYADHNNVLFEICNEPNGDTSWSDVKSYAEEIIPIIRQNDKDAVILVGTPNWSQYVDQAASDPITGYDNIMYTLHFYAATHQEDLRNTLKTALAQNLPVFVSEYSICDASGNGAIDEAQANEWMSLLDQYHISCVNWSLSNKDETASILKSDCTKTSDFESSDLSQAGLWLYSMLTAESDEESTSSTENSDSENNLDPQTSSVSAADFLDNPFASESNLETEAYSCTIQISNKWETDGICYYQYNLSITNTSDSTINNWEVSLPFNTDITLSDSWNCNCSLDGTTLCITALDYNSALKKGNSANDIGFIISCP